MSLALLNCKFVLGGYNLSGVSNAMTLEHGAEMLDDTHFGTNGTRSNKPGLKTVSASASGHVDTTLDEAMYNRIAAVREVLSIAYDGETEGDVGFITRAVNGTYTPLAGEVGQLVTFEFSALSANSPLVRARALAWGAKTTDGNGTGIQLPAVTADQRVYASLHVTNFLTLTNIIVTIESASDALFTTPTTRLTFTTMTDIGANWQELAGPITDTYWRAKWDVTGSGSASIWVNLGIE